MGDAGRSPCFAALSGLLLAASFPPLALYPLAFAALAPLLLASRHCRPWRGFVAGWVAGVAFYASAWWWVVPTIARMQQLPLLLAAIVFAAFVAYHALHPALFAVVATRLNQSGGVLSILGNCSILAAWWTLLEYAFPRIIPWYLADALAPSPFLRQAADLGGAYLLSFVVVFINTCFAAVIERRGHLSRSLQVAAIASLSMTLLAGYGAARLNLLRGNPSVTDGQARSLSVAIVQGAIISGRADIAAANEDAWRIYEPLTRALPHDEERAAPDFVIWPETTLRAYLNHDRNYRRRIETLVTQLETPLLLGALDWDRGERSELNSAYLFATPRSQPALVDAQVYHKRVLLPFGETVPGTSFLPFLGRWRTTGDFVRGKLSDPTTFTLRTPSEPELILAPSICFEAILPGFFNEAVRDGASLLINVTDDGWFGDTSEPAQHLNATILRAVETRRWLVRASNSGISAFVNPQGDIVAQLPLGQIGTLTESVQTSRVTTPYVRFGNWPILVSAIILITALWWRRQPLR